MSGSQSLDELKARLDPHAVDICERMYGKPTTQRRHEYRWGRRGSVQLVRRKGRWRWNNYETGEGGSLLDAIMSSHGCDLAGTIKWARDWLVDEPAGPQARQHTAELASAPDIDIEQELNQKQAIAIWQSGRSVVDTPADQYLRQHRGIGAIVPHEVARYIEGADIRRRRPQWYWWRWPGALVVAATDNGGTVTGVQLIALETDGAAALHWDNGGKLKLSLGKLAGSVVRLPGDDATPLLLAEGFETAASCWWAAEYETWAQLGSIARAPLDGVPVSRTVIICADDDARDAPSNKALNDAIRGWRREGRTVFLVKPWGLTRCDKSDFNDTLRDEGREAVRKRIRAAIKPVFEPAFPGVEKARRNTADAIGKAMGRLAGWRQHATEDEIAPFLVARVGFGIGKTETAIEHAIGAVRRGGQVAFLVPTHRLGGELLERIEAAARRQGVEAVVQLWRGREAARPDDADQTMCAELKAVWDAQSAYADVAGTVCKVCPHRGECPYLAQGKGIAQIWVGAHELLLHPPPAPMKGTTLLVIDEGFTNRIGFIGIAGKPLLLQPEEILAALSLDSVFATANLLHELMPFRRALAAALTDHPAGALDRQRLLDAGLS